MLTKSLEADPAYLQSRVLYAKTLAKKQETREKVLDILEASDSRLSDRPAHCSSACSSG